MSVFVFVSLQLAVVAYAFVGGVFLGFSDFIMRSLARTGGVGGVDAMQVINREVFRWIFMTLFLGLVPVSLLIVGYGGFALGKGPGVLMVVAGIVYLVGCFGVTARFNVPMNEALGGMDLSTPSTMEYWTKTYVPSWTFWNSIRTVACGASSMFLLSGLLWLARAQG